MRRDLRGRRVVLVWALAVVVGCAAPLAPTTGPTPPAEPTTTPSAIVTPAPTASPTTAPTPSPSPTPSAAPETPAAVTSIDQILGVWWVFDAQAGGPNHINFREDGTYRLGHGPYPGIEVDSGTFSLEADTLTWHEGWFDCPADQVGTYTLTLSRGGDLLHFEAVDDECNERLEQGFGIWRTWMRGKPPTG